MLKFEIFEFVWIDQKPEIGIWDKVEKEKLNLNELTWLLILLGWRVVIRLIMMEGLILNN